MDRSWRHRDAGHDGYRCAPRMLRAVEQVGWTKKEGKLENLK